MVTAEFPRKLAGRKSERNIGNAVEQEEKIYNEVETAREIAHLGDRLGAGGGWKAAIYVKTRCGWVRSRKIVELLYGRLPLKLKGAVNKTM